VVFCLLATSWLEIVRTMGTYEDWVTFQEDVGIKLWRICKCCMGLHHNLRGYYIDS